MQDNREYRINNQLEKAKRLKRYLDENFLSRISIPDLAIQLKFDWRYIGAAFIQLFGVTITDYVNLLRIDTACRLIKETPSIKIINLSSMCGYSSQENFSRIFKSIVKMSPRIYALKLKSGVINEFTYCNNLKNVASL